MDDQFCSASGAFCQPQWAVGVWWLLLVGGGLVMAAYGRYRRRWLERLAVDLGLSPGQFVVWRRGENRWSRWLAFGAIETSLVTVVVVGVVTRNVAMGFESFIIPVGVYFAILLAMDLRWLWTLHPTPEDIEPLDPSP